MMIVLVKGFLNSSSTDSVEQPEDTDELNVSEIFN